MIGLDYETFCEVDLPKHGADRYFSDPSFTVLIAGIASTDVTSYVYDFVLEPEKLGEFRRVLDNASKIAAHNASFERRATESLCFVPAFNFVDSAAIARAVGAGSKLEAAAPQLLGVDKLEEGKDLIKLFSIPNAENHGKPFTREAILSSSELFKKWEQFKHYCAVDAQLSRRIANENWVAWTSTERQYEILTQRMNNIGWFVDLPLVHEMQRRFKYNTAELEQDFRFKYDPAGRLNLASYKQLQTWCAERGVRARSFDQLNVTKLIRQLNTRLGSPRHQQLLAAGDVTAKQQEEDYRAVLDLLLLKQELGGSSLSKLQTIIDMTGTDGRLRGQYLHIGAGQSYRTSGRGVQLQNLARLPAEPNNVELLMNDPDVEWTNDMLAHNIRQCFKAEDPNGELIVGDFSAVESRGLAYLAGEDWKLLAYRQNKDIYKMLATTYQSFGGVRYEDVTKAQRQAGKVGELACGYGAGPGAVASFAEKMGMDMTEAEATQIVRDWRAANTRIVDFWSVLDLMLHGVVEHHKEVASIDLPSGGEIVLSQMQTPVTLQTQHPGAQSIVLSVYGPDKQRFLRRVFHGCYMRGNDVCYYKPSELKSGDLWRARMTQPPHAWYKLYGGKLAGILTQSFCRELFFQSMLRLSRALHAADEPSKLIGQFHDELVVEWSPSDSLSLPTTIHMMDAAMSDPGVWTDFPLVADVKHAHRYIK